jgi:hypothetical protein
MRDIAQRDAGGAVAEDGRRRVLGKTNVPPALADWQAANRSMGAPTTP